MGDPPKFSDLIYFLNGCHLIMSVQVHLCNVLLEKPQSLWCRKQNAIVHSSCCGGIVTWTTSSHAVLSNHTLWLHNAWSLVSCTLCNHVQLPSLWQNSSPSSPSLLHLFLAFRTLPPLSPSLPSPLFPLLLPLLSPHHADYWMYNRRRAASTTS